MRSMKMLVGTAVALSMAATPALAQSSAARLSVANAPIQATGGPVRVATPAKNGSRIAGAPIIPLILLVAFVAGAVIVATDDDSPDSP